VNLLFLPTMTKWKSFSEKLGNWELWPFKLRYLLISPVWLSYCLRARSFWFFSSSNPTLTFGGFEGEGKKEMYDQLPKGSFPRTVYVASGEPFEAVKQKLQENGFVYPFIVKPDVGMKGLLFRKIDNESQLAFYHRRMPVEYIIQDLVEFPLEVSVFYYRMPDSAKGAITGFIQKDLMDVVGDGTSTLWQLILQHPKAKHRLEEMKVKHEANLGRVIPSSERYILTYAANLNRGASFTNLSEQIDEQLVHVFDAISRPAQFYYGRYDIKCSSVSDLKNGSNFAILEFNGSGAEPNHVYNCGFSLIRALREFLFHWKVLYKISQYNHKHGHPYWSFLRGWRYLRQAKKHLKVLEQLDQEILI
jgi:hypothetical protein